MSSGFNRETNGVSDNDSNTLTALNRNRTVNELRLNQSGNVAKQILSQSIYFIDKTF